MFGKVILGQIFSEKTQAAQTSFTLLKAAVSPCYL